VRRIGHAVYGNDMNFLSWQLPQIDAEAAWDVSLGDPNIIVAIVDDAVLLDHEDLTDQIWTNTGEIAGDSIDNDGNGYIDDVNGYDVAHDDPDANPPSNATNQAFSHGTHVAGIAGASSDNNKGISSIGFNLSIMPVKCKIDSTINDPFLQSTYLGIDYAIVNKAHVVNMSFGSEQNNNSTQYLIQAGVDSGMVFVAAAGNSGNYGVNYPAAYQDVISVASTGFSDTKSGFSTYHHTVDVSAPGSVIYSTTAGTNQSYGVKSGTSMSSPLVAGLIGLMRSVDNTRDPIDYRLCLRNTADDIDPLNPDYVGWLGHGRINAQGAVACLAVATDPPVSGLSQGLELHPIFPHPAPGRAAFSATIPHHAHMRLSLRDLRGREIATLHEGEVDPGVFEYRFTGVPSMTTGMYLVVWEYEGEQLVQKLSWQ
ncbi:MAG: S8 family serine peptidase, partial [Bacteroidota bacterium]